MSEKSPLDLPPELPPMDGGPEDPPDKLDAVDPKPVLPRAAEEEEEEELEDDELLLLLEEDERPVRVVAAMKAEEADRAVPVTPPPDDIALDVLARVSLVDRLLPEDEEVPALDWTTNVVEPPLEELDAPPEEPPLPRLLRLPRRRGVTSVTNCSAPVDPVTRIVFSSVPATTGAVRTAATAGFPVPATGCARHCSR
jgi:hypothetical protein